MFYLMHKESVKVAAPIFTFSFNAANFLERKCFWNSLFLQLHLLQGCIKQRNLILTSTKLFFPYSVDYIVKFLEHSDSDS